MTAELHCTTELLSGRYRFMSVGEQTALLHHFHLLGYRLATLEWEGGGIRARPSAQHFDEIARLIRHPTASRIIVCVNWLVI